MGWGCLSYQGHQFSGHCCTTVRFYKGLNRKKWNSFAIQINFLHSFKKKWLLYYCKNKKCVQKLILSLTKTKLDFSIAFFRPWYRLHHSHIYYLFSFTTIEANSGEFLKMRFKSRNFNGSPSELKTMFTLQKADLDSHGFRGEVTTKIVEEKAYYQVTI